MRRSMLAFIVAVGILGGPSVSVVEAEVAAEAAAEWFPLPKDAVAQNPSKGGLHGKEGTPSKDQKKTSSVSRIRTYEVPRGRDAVVAETRAVLKTRKWEIVKDEPAASGNAVRLTVKKHGKTFKAGITGDATRAVIIVTAPGS